MKDFFGKDIDRNVSHYFKMTDTPTEDSGSVLTVATYIIFSIGMPLTLMAIYSAYFTVRSDPVAAIYVFNLIIADLIQLCCMFISEVPSARTDYIAEVYLIAVQASIGFMVSLAIERYMAIVHPLWYRIRRSIKSSVVVCAVVWIVSIVYFLSNIVIIPYILVIPVLIFCLVQTSRALFRSVSIPFDEKLRVMVILVLVLLPYILLFLPFLIFLFTRDLNSFEYQIFLGISPLTDLVLCVFIWKGAVSKLLNAMKCCKMKRNDTETATTGGNSRSSV